MRSQQSIKFCLIDYSASGSDFFSESIRVIFAPGESQKMVPIQTNPDDEDEDTEQFIAMLSTEEERVVLIQQQADIIIHGECVDGKHYFSEHCIMQQPAHNCATL